MNHLEERFIERTIKGLFPTKEIMKYCLTNISDVILHANMEKPDNWGITLEKEFLRVNIGKIEVIAKFDGFYHCIINKYSLPDHISIMKGVQVDLENKKSPGSGIYKSVIGSGVCNIDDKYISQVLPIIINSQRVLIDNALKTSRNPATIIGHSPEVVTYLSKIIGVELPHPLYENKN
jgi:hypothetical protein